jgi:hypothetical protein
MRLPHIPACVTIRVAGWPMTPLVIVLKKNKMDNLIEFENSTDFARPTSGWITKPGFPIWTVLFIGQIGIYAF